MMEPDQIIERIGSDDNPPTVEELAAVKTELEAVQETLRASIKDKSAGHSLAELRSMKDDFDNIATHLSTVSDALVEAERQVEEIVAAVGGPDDDGDDNDDEDGDDADEPQEVTAEKVPVAASLRSASSTIARVRETAPVAEVNETDLSQVTTSFTLRGKDRDEVAPAEIGKALADTARQFGGTKTTVLGIKHELHPDRTLSGDASANERKMLDLFGAQPFVPVTAAGGCCSIPEPIYEQPMIGSLERPIRAAFDVLNASRGAVQAYPPVCMPDAGADVWTCAQDEAVVDDDPDTWKSCTDLECDESEPTLVEPIYKCITVGTFQERFAPEQWEAFSFQVDKLAARLAEARLFRWLAESATSVYDAGDIDTGSTYANFIKTQLRIAAAMRQDQRLGDSQIISVGSNLIYSAIAEDTLTRRLNVTDEVEFWKSKVDETLRNFGITYIGSDDVATMTPFSYDGTIPAYPAELPIVMLPAGAAKVLDGGEKNIGVTSDHNLNRQNRVAIFDEFWEGLLVRNCNVVFANIAVEDCDLGCPPVAS